MMQENKNEGQEKEMPNAVSVALDLDNAQTGLKRKMPDHANSSSEAKRLKIVEAAKQQMSQLLSNDELKAFTVHRETIPTVQRQTFSVNPVVKQVKVSKKSTDNAVNEEKDVLSRDGNKSDQAVKKSFNIMTLMQTRKSKKEALILFEEPSVNYDERTLKVYNYILNWINFRLIDKKINKQISGLYLWSKQTDLGKTLLCNTLGKVFRCYTWVFCNVEWQQDYKSGDCYDMIIYNALNSNLLNFHQVELHGDGMKIGVPKRNDRQQATINAYTPFMITSNKHPTELGYNEFPDMDPWMKRMLVINVDGAPLFPVIDKIIQHFKIPVLEEDDISYFEYFDF